MFAMSLLSRIRYVKFKLILKRAKSTLVTQINTRADVFHVTLDYFVVKGK